MPEPLSEEKKQEWKDRIQKQHESGLSIKCWCEKNDVSSRVFYYWRFKLSQKTSLTRSQFTEITDSRDVGISIECNGVRIHLEKHFDALILKRCLSILKEIKC